MSEKKKKISKLCLSGFILSILSAVLLILYVCFSWELRDYVYLCIILYAAIALLPLIGLVLSIVGLATAGKKGKSGKGFGIAGIILPNISAVFAVIIIVFFGSLFLIGNADMQQSEKHSDVSSMGGVWTPSNTEYDVSQYKISKGYELNSSEKPVSESEFKAYAKGKLQEITDESEIRIKGKYQDYNFLIIRRDRFDEWKAGDQLVNIYWDEGGYAMAHYSVLTEFAKAANLNLAIYKDPSEKYIIITNCSDYKVIKELFD